MTSFARRWGPRAGQLLLTGTAVLGTLCAVLAVLAAVLGVRPVVFRSGSMEPAVSTGALGLSRSTDAADLKVGDVVTVKSAQGKTITHRIIAVGPGDDSASLRLKGDDNPAPDQEIYEVSQAPKLWFSVPGAGYAVAWLAKAPGSYLLGGYVMLMLMLAFRRRPASGGHDSPIDAPGGSKPDMKPDLEPAVSNEQPVRDARRGPLVVAATGAVVVALAAAVVSGWSQTTWAAWNDSVATSGTSITTGNFNAPPAAPVGVTCTAGSAAANTITIGWTAVSGATGYIVTRSPGGTNSVAGTSLTFTGSNNATGTASVQAVGPGGNSAASASISYTFGNGNNKAPACS